MAEKTFHLIDETAHKDLSPYVVSYTWGGDLEQAGRRLNFTIAYTTKDPNWTNAIINLGDIVTFYYYDPTLAEKEREAEKAQLEEIAKEQAERAEAAKQRAANISNSSNSVSGGSNFDGYSSTERGNWSAIQALGATQGQANGICGNIRIEDMDYDPTVVNASGHTGLYQLSTERWAGYVSWCNQTGNDPAYGPNQSKYVLTVENGNVFTGENCPWGAMPTDTEGAARYVSQYIERGGYEQERVDAANNIANDVANEVITLETPGAAVATMAVNALIDTSKVPSNNKKTTTTAETADTTTADKNNTNSDSLKLFQGIVFMQERNSNTYTMEFVAYDRLIYLAKSKTNNKFVDVPIPEVLDWCAKQNGLELGILSKDLNYTVNFVADNMSYTEIIQKCLETAKQNSGYSYNVYLSAENKMNVVRADTVIEGFTITDTTDSFGARHSASLEDMVNQVAIADSDGKITGYFRNDEDINKYGRIQTVYKVDAKQNTEKSAKSLLHKITETSSISALGNVQCIAGYAVAIQEEQIKGNFLILSDSHKIENNIHTMELNLSYIQKPDDSTTCSKEGNTNPTPKQVKKKKDGVAGTGSATVEEGLKAAKPAYLGTQMPDGPNGCVEAVVGIGSYYSPFAKQEYDNNVKDCDTLVADAQQANLYEEFGPNTVIQKGDAVIYSSSQYRYAHTVIVTSPSGRYIGNSSSANNGNGEVVEGRDFMEMGGEYPVGVVHLSKG